MTCALDEAHGEGPKRRKMGTPTMERAAAKLASGSFSVASFQQFCRETASDWDRLSFDLFRRWPLPEGVEQADLRQEMLAEVWRVFTGWDNSSRSLVDYITWNAYAAARKWVHKQRDAYRRDGKAPSRFPSSESKCAERMAASAGGDASWSIDQMADVALGPEDLYAVREARALMRRGLDLDEQRIVRLLEAERGTEPPGVETARLLLEDPRYCIRRQFWTIVDAQRHVRNVAEKAASLIDAEAA